MITPKKVLVIDDSAFMRRVISDIINYDEKCQVVGTANNGKDGLEKIRLLEPDVVILDIEMPVMNGLQMLEALREQEMLPVIMMSTLVEKGAKETIRALELGAYDFVKKPDNIFKVNSEEIKNELISKIISASKSKVQILNKVKPVKLSSFRNSRKLDDFIENTKVNNIVAIGTSTGGPRALQYVLPYLPKNINAGIVIVQHMPPGFTKSLSERLNNLSEIYIKEAKDGDIIKNGCAYIAPGGKHLEVINEFGALKIRLSDAPVDNGHKPSVNYMMKSLSKIANKKYIGVIMTGMGSDGALGMQDVKNKCGMYIIAQDEPSCVVYGMPKSVINLGIADEIISLDSIANSIIKQSGVL